MNIISLLVLIMGLGMMVDNSIIVVGNVNQYLALGVTTYMACVHGANEVNWPLISSV
jgi:multidrug efflux pump subunit AcrB